MARAAAISLGSTLLKVARYAVTARKLRSTYGLPSAISATGLPGRDQRFDGVRQFPAQHTHRAAIGAHRSEGRHHVAFAAGEAGRRA